MKVNDIVGTHKRKHRDSRKHRMVQPDNLYRVTPADLNEIVPVPVIVEGGSMPGVGAIHHSEIDATIAGLEKELGIDLRSNVLGSVGKKEYSGDIDIAIDLPKEQLPAFAEKLESSSLIHAVTKSSVFMTSVDIVGYNAENTKDGIQRTGKVQIDFMPGDPEWMKMFYHSPHEKGMDPDGRSSNYKGTYRNLMISMMASTRDVKTSEETIDDGRPVEQERYMWSSADGLVRVVRRPVPKKNGQGYTKKNANTIIKGPWKQAPDIAKVLGIDSADDLYSFETLYAAVKKNYSTEIQQKIFTTFARDGKVQAMGLPTELRDYA